MRIARAQTCRVRARKRRGHEHGRLVDYPADKIRDQRDVEARRITNCRPVRAAEAEQIDGVNGIGAGEGVDVIAPLVRPGRRMDPMNEKDRRPLAVSGEGDPSVTPFESSFLATNQVDELVDALSRERVVSRGSAEEGAARQQDLFPWSFRLFVVLLHQTPSGSVKKKLRHRYSVFNKQGGHTNSD